MPSVKRKKIHLQKERAQIAKTNCSLTSFFIRQTDTDSVTEESRETVSSTISPPDQSLPLSESPDISDAVQEPEPVNNNTVHSDVHVNKTPRVIRKAKHKLGFDIEWTRNRPWLLHKLETVDGKSVEVMICTLCQKHKTLGKNGSDAWSKSGYKSLRLDKVKEHEESSQHKEAVRLETKSQVTIEDSITRKNPLSEKEFDAVVCATKCVHFLVKHNIPITTVYEDFIEFAVNDLQSPILANLSKGKNATYKSRTTAEELLLAMSEDIEETLKQRIKRSPAYAIMTDEATDISNKKHLAFCAKYVDETTGEINVDFVKDVQVDNGKAETIFKETIELVQDEICIDNFAAFGSDGCNTMIGKKSGVTTRLKEVKPELVTVHCHNHRLALAAKDSFKSIKVFEETDEVLSSIHKYYKSSSNRTTSLEKLQNVLDDCETKRIKQVAHTRWLSHYDAVTSLKDTYPAVIMDLENAVESGNDKVRIGSGPSASGLAKKLKSYQTVHIIHFLCDALKPLIQLALTFETNSVDLSVIKPKMDSTVSALKKLKTLPGVSQRKAAKLMDDFEINGNEQKISAVHEAENQFIDNLIENIENRLENSDIIDAMSVFDMSGKGSFDGNDEIELISDHFSEDVDSALYEWDSLKDNVAELDPSVKNSPSTLLKTIMTIAPTTGNRYPVIIKLCARAAVLPVSTAEVERVFSSVNRIVTDLRNRLTVKNTNKLLHVLKNDKYLNYECAVKRWLKAKPRRISM